MSQAPEAYRFTSNIAYHENACQGYSDSSIGFSKKSLNVSQLKELTRIFTNDTTYSPTDMIETTVRKIRGFTQALECVLAMNGTHGKHLNSLAKVFWMMYNTNNQTLMQSLKKPDGYVSRLFSNESWTEWTNSSSNLGRVACVFTNYALNKHPLYQIKSQIQQIDSETLLQANKEAKKTLKKLGSLDVERSEGEGSIYSCETCDPFLQQIFEVSPRVVKGQVKNMFGSIPELERKVQIFCKLQEPNLLLLFSKKEITYIKHYFKELTLSFSPPSDEYVLYGNACCDNLVPNKSPMNRAPSYDIQEMFDFKELKHLFRHKEAFELQEEKFLFLKSKNKMEKEIALKEHELSAYRLTQTYCQKFEGDQKSISTLNLEERAILDKLIKDQKAVDAEIGVCIHNQYNARERLFGSPLNFFNLPEDSQLFEITEEELEQKRGPILQEVKDLETTIQQKRESHLSFHEAIHASGKKIEFLTLCQEHGVESARKIMLADLEKLVQKTEYSLQKLKTDRDLAEVGLMFQAKKTT